MILQKEESMPPWRRFLPLLPTSHLMLVRLPSLKAIVILLMFDVLIICSNHSCLVIFIIIIIGCTLYFKFNMLSRRFPV